MAVSSSECVATRVVQGCQTIAPNRRTTRNPAGTPPRPRQRALRITIANTINDDAKASAIHVSIQAAGYVFPADFAIDGIVRINQLGASLSEVARDWFGDDFVDHFAATRDWEWRQWLDGVTDWEMKRYFEII